MGSRYLGLPDVDLLGDLCKLGDAMVFSCLQNTLQVMDTVCNGDCHLLTLSSCLWTLVERSTKPGMRKLPYMEVWLPFYGSKVHMKITRSTSASCQTSNVL